MALEGDGTLGPADRLLEGQAAGLELLDRLAQLGERVVEREGGDVRVVGGASRSPGQSSRGSSSSRFAQRPMRGATSIPMPNPSARIRPRRSRGSRLASGSYRVASTVASSSPSARRIRSVVAGGASLGSAHDRLVGGAPNDRVAAFEGRCGSRTASAAVGGVETGPGEAPGCASRAAAPSRPPRPGAPVGRRGPGRRSGRPGRAAARRVRVTWRAGPAGRAGRAPGLPGRGRAGTPRGCASRRHRSGRRRAGTPSPTRPGPGRRAPRPPMASAPARRRRSRPASRRPRGRRRRRPARCERRRPGRRARR